MIVSLFFGALALFGVILFHLGTSVPVVLSAALMAFSAAVLWMLYRRSHVGPLTLLLFVVFMLPFIHVVPYIWFDYEARAPAKLWGLAVNPYMVDRPIIELMSLIGAVGAVAFVAGASGLSRRISWPRARSAALHQRNRRRGLSLGAFGIWVAVGIFFSWLSAPSQTIFTAAYGQSLSVFSSWHFSAGWMSSYSLLIFALADSIFERRVRHAQIKRIIIFAAIVFVAVWFQLLRGDRECLPFIVSAGLMYFIWGGALVRRRWKGIGTDKIKAIFVGGIVLLAAYLVGTVRHVVTGVQDFSSLANVLQELAQEGTLAFHGLVHGTWSAVLLTPLSVAGDYINGSLPLKYGSTYLDLAQSIIPGFVAEWIGYVRPIDALRGPAWEMTYGIGGTHATVIPFMDFRMLGVVVVIALWAHVFTRVERYATHSSSVTSIALMGTVAMAAPHWLWYGEKNIINALIIWFMLAFLYRIRLGSVQSLKWRVRSPEAFFAGQKS